MNNVIKDVKSKPQFRTFEINRAGINEENRTVELAFSSETPVERFWGIEILDHSAKAVDLARLQDGGAVLKNHDVTEHHAVVEGVRIDRDKVGRATIRFSSKPESENLFRDVVDGISRKVSVGYLINDMILEKEEKDKPNQYRVTSWQPYEISFVSIPADSTVGVGRSGEHSQSSVRTTMETKKETPPARVPTPEEVKALEKIRREDIDAIALKFHDRIKGGKAEMEKMKEAAIHLDRPSELFKGDVYLRINDNRPVETPVTFVDGMTKKEVATYSLSKAINAMASRDWTKAGLELRASQDIAEKLHRDPQGIFVPLQIQRNQQQQRDLTAGTTTAGGFTVATDMLPFIDWLAKKPLVVQMGATVLTGLRGNIAIPKGNTGSTAYWVAENIAVTESDHAFLQLTMGPKTVGTFTDLSRLLIQQSSLDAEALIRNEITRGLRIELDRASIHGTGADGQPTGLIGVSGIGDVAGGTDGLAPTWAHVVALETEVAQDDADFGRMGYLTNAKVRGKLKTTFRNTTYGEIPVWGEGSMPFGGLNFYRAGVSNNVASNLVKGGSGAVCSAIFFGNWEALIIGEWGIMDVLVDPYTGGAAGTVRVRVLVETDIQCKWPQAFSAMKDALTT